MKKYKFAFFGTPKFAALILEKLIKANLPPEAVVSNPDKPLGRQKIITPPPAKIVAQKFGIPILQPKKVSEIEPELKKINPDFCVVAAYSKIIPLDILKIPRLGTIGVHPSLLPKYRGPSPIQFAILNGETETGTTLFLLNEKVDTGKILIEKKCKILKEENAEDLSERLAEISADSLIEIIPDFIENKIAPQEQRESEATYTTKIETADAFIEPEKINEATTTGDYKDEIERKVRAFTPEPGAWTIFKHSVLIGKNQLPGGKRIKILKSELENGRLKIKKVQVEGKKPIDLF